MSVDLDSILDPLRKAVQEQGDVVRKLKEENAPEQNIKKALALLKAKKKILEDKEIELTPKNKQFDRQKFEYLLKHRFFYDQAFDIYGGVQGLFDYGDMGCAVKSKLLAAWREFFIEEEQMLEVECTMLTPEPVLKASGHVDRFTDYMVRDAVLTGVCFRADHLVEEHLEALVNDKKTSPDVKNEAQTLLNQIDNLGAPELQSVIQRFGIKAPQTGNDLTEVQRFNLMFGTSIGPAGNIKAYLRPETAQGIFVNFEKLLRSNQGKLPFAVAQIGTSFRNEISPRQGLLRVREFTMAEIEHFLDPTDKSHPEFERVANLMVPLYSACDQMEGRGARQITIGDAVSGKMIANQTLGYFMGRIYQFLMLVGIHHDQFRFRQHMSNEMAHYAQDCWDAECRTSYGWIECVGCADRSCYDLKQHTAATGTKLCAEVHLKTPKEVSVVEAVCKKAVVGKSFKADAKAICAHFEALSLQEVEQCGQSLLTDGKVNVSVNDKEFVLTEDMLEIKRYVKTVHVEEIVPNVIEPSFGIGRIMQCVFEQNFRIRGDDEQRTYLSLPPLIAPYKCSVLALSGKEEFTPVVKEICKLLKSCSVSYKVDSSSTSIGRRYARTDQIGIPFGVTVDFDTLHKSPASVTLRERESMQQIRVNISEVPKLIKDLCEGITTWAAAIQHYPIFEEQETNS